MQKRYLQNSSTVNCNISTFILTLPKNEIVIQSIDPIELRLTEMCVKFCERCLWTTPYHSYVYY